MSEFNEELLNDVEDTDLDDADEDALLQDDDEGDGDVIDLIPDEELEESQNDSRITGEDEDPDDDNKRKDKFSVERKAITAPESPVEEAIVTRPNKFQRPNNNNRGQQRGRGFNNFGRGGHNMGRGKFHNGGNRGRFSYGHESGKNKTVLINPRFQGVVHVNNNARLAWDSSQQPQQYPPNPWATGAPPGQMQQMQPMQGLATPGPPMQGMHQGPPMHQQQQQQQIPSFQPPPHMQPNYHSSPMQQPIMQGPPQNMTPQAPFMPPQSFMPQPLPPGVHHQQPPIQPASTMSYWDGQTQYTAVEQSPPPGGNPFMQQNNYQPSPPVINFQPPPQTPTPNYPMYNNQQENNNMFPPMHQQQQFTPNRNFVPQNRQGFPNNNNNQFHQGNNMPQQNRKQLFTQKRKMMTPGFTPNKKFNQRQPRNVQQLQTNTNTFGVKIENRPTTIKELTVTNVTTVKIEEEDEQTRDLRTKIEQQKREREAILQWKEKRRLEKLLMTGQQDTTPPETAAQKPKVVVHQPVQPPPRPQQQQQPTNSPIKMERRPQQQPPPQTQNRRMQYTQKVVQQVLTPIVPVKLKKQSNNIVITSGYSKKFTKYQKKNLINCGRVVQPVPTSTVISVHTTPMVPSPDMEVDKKHLSNFLADRKILTKDESLMATRKVVIKNISTSTGDKKIMSISKSIGDVQKLHRDKNERQATITFKSVASAHAFFKKYQRHMLDLSMIEVSLCPMGESDE